MYQVDALDRVIEISDFPQSSLGAPLPSVIATEHQTFLLFHLEEHVPDWDGTWVRCIGAETDGLLAIIAFNGCYARMFGPPNDEAFAGHPLAARGLHPYGAFRIENSSWLRGLEIMNAVHPNHSSARFRELNHFVFAFHDSNFECIAAGYTIETTRSSIRNTLLLTAERIGR
jgi:hypothetical protein